MNTETVLFINHSIKNQFPFFCLKPKFLKLELITSDSILGSRLINFGLRKNWEETSSLIERLMNGRDSVIIL